MHNDLWKCSFVMLTVFAMVFVFVDPSWGSEWAVSPRVGILEEYNDNLLFSREGQELDDWVTYVTPRVQGTYQTEKLRLSLDSGIGAEKYVDYDEYDTIDHDHRMALSYALSRALGVNIGGYFQEDTTLESELVEEGLLVHREDRRKFGGNLGFTYVFSTRVSVSGDWTARYTEYPDHPLYYDDRRSHTLTLSPRYTLSPKTSLFLNLAYTNTEYDEEGNPSIVNYTIAPSFRHDFTQHSYVSGGAGYRYTEEDTLTVDEHSDSFVFDLSFHRNWKKLSLELLSGIDQYSSIDVRSVQRAWLTLKGSYRLGARLTTSAAATLRRNRVDKGGYGGYGGYDEDSDYYTVSPALSYDLTPTVRLTGSMDYSKYDYDEYPDEDRERFRARLALDCAWPRLWSGK
jgi:hypothetical protein